MDVIAGLDPAIQQVPGVSLDSRVKPANDRVGSGNPANLRPRAEFGGAEHVEGGLAAGGRLFVVQDGEGAEDLADLERALSH